MIPSVELEAYYVCHYIADECTSKQMRISFARLLVEVDVTKELPKSVAVQDPSGKTIIQKVVYEWPPPYCPK